MAKISLQVFSLSLLLSFGACSSNGSSEAKLALDKARSFFAAKEYEQAKAEIDSLKKLYPKAFDEIKTSFSLLDSIRHEENIDFIKNSDISINEQTRKADSLKQFFVMKKDPKYDEQGTFVPKNNASGAISSTGLRSGVREDGSMYIESIFVGGSKKHHTLKVSSKNGSSATTLPETGDGLNYKINPSIEIIRYVEATENGVFKFIYENRNQPLTVTLEGQTKNSYPLPSSAINDISRSYTLSNLIKQRDSLSEEKEKAMLKLEYLIKKKTKD